jgi:porin
MDGERCRSCNSNPNGSLVASPQCEAQPRTPRRRMTRYLVWCMACLAIIGGTPGVAAPAASPDPDLTLSARETVDVWRNTKGGLRVGWTSLSKLQVSATWTANALHDPGFRIHAQVFRTNGERLTSRTGDLQTASNIEALSTDRLFEAWAEQTFGNEGHGGWALRTGLIDLNSDFDSIDPASLFIDSSHGIGPDISKSGRNGPSIFPVSAAAVRLTWTPTENWTVRGGVFDGVPGNPDHPKAFAAVRLSARDGVLSILQADRKLSKDAQISLGVWGYSRGVQRLDGGGPQGDAGVYGFVEGPIPMLGGWTGWVRVGLGDPSVQVIYGYLGGGLTKKGVFAARPDDRLGFAVSRAAISPDARRLNGLSRAETTFEGAYQIKVRDWVAVQPDVQYIVHPSSQTDLGDALVVGLRLVITAGYPRRAPATEQTDPTVAPDAPPDALPGASKPPA